VLYKKFSKTITLEIVKRQGGEDQEAIVFRTALSNVRMGRSTFKDWQLLSYRVASKVRLTDEDLTRFETALRIYQKREEVKSYKELNNPVLIIRAAHHGRGESSGTNDDAGNLAATIPLSINSRVMLLDNIWAECGLFNDAMGFVRDFVWVDGADPTKDTIISIAYVFTLISLYRFMYLSTSTTLAYSSTNLLTYLPTYLFTYLPTYLLTLRLFDFNLYTPIVCIYRSINDCNCYDLSSYYPGLKLPCI
jgi:hypothetical protein